MTTDEFNNIVGNSDEKWKTNGGIIGSKAYSCCNGV
jgi:hypothetical protein